MTAQGRITTARIIVGTYLRVRPTDLAFRPASNLRDSVEAEVVAITRTTGLQTGYNLMVRYTDGTLRSAFSSGSQTHMLSRLARDIRGPIAREVKA
jgi:hypothetical protein